MIRDLAYAIVIGWTVSAWASGALESACTAADGTGGRYAIASAP